MANRFKELGLKGTSELALYVLLAVFTLFFPFVVALLWFVAAAGVYTGTWELTKFRVSRLIEKAEAKLPK